MFRVFRGRRLRLIPQSWVPTKHTKSTKTTRPPAWGWRGCVPIQLLESGRQFPPARGVARLRWVALEAESSSPSANSCLPGIRRPFTKKSVSSVSSISWAQAEFESTAIGAHETHEKHENYTASGLGLARMCSYSTFGERPTVHRQSKVLPGSAGFFSKQNRPLQA